LSNPWLHIPPDDYEKHMLEVGQAQALNKLCSQALEKYSPERFALIGCSTGNGLEHVNSIITKATFAVDINADYLRKTKEKYQGKIENLNCIHADIQNEEPPLSHIDLFFVGLVLEYVNPEITLRKLIRYLRDQGVITIVIQRSNQTSFVSKTNFKSLQKLSSISKEVDEELIHNIMSSEKMKLLQSKKISLTESKYFIVLEYRKI